MRYWSVPVSIVAIWIAFAGFLVGDLYQHRVDAQAMRQGAKLPSGPARYYLREGSRVEMCAPYLADGQPAWSCVPTSTAINLILKTPPDCGPQ